LQPERSHLLNADDPYNASGYGYGSASQDLASRHVLNPEEAKREQEALEGITRWTTEYDSIEIPQHNSLHILRFLVP
jgi:Late endosomal/lysosomal adaptor and MAPK and MTOR activator